MLHWFWIIPFLPFAGALVNGLLGRRLGRAVVAAIACGSVLLAFLLSAGAFLALSGADLHALAGAEGMRVDAEHRQVQLTLWNWIPGGPGASLSVDWGFLLDPLSAVMILVVTGVGFLIHVYSVGYMHDDPGFARYFSYLNLFTGMMLTLVLGASFPVLFVGWEGVGLCSYLLIGFWYEDLEKAKAGMKAFIVNRIGDFGFMLGMLLILFYYGTLDIQAVIAAALGTPVALTVICLLLFLGATGKSAQIPLYTWLPDAMAGPTPVSALIHAATMVTAGVYMVARTSGLFLSAPAALVTVAVVGAITALFAGTIATAQTDIKKVLAYSTVSQLGYMFLACGVGAFTAGIFHLMTHAFFKALLFLAAGSVIHAMSGKQDMTEMGGLAGKLPATFRTMLIGTLAIAGIPPLAGFFSKDEILEKAWENGGTILWLLGSVTALLTSFYVFRLIYLTFAGGGRMDDETAHHVHESPASMTVPLWILAVLSIVGGFVGIPAALSFGHHWNRFEQWLAPVFAGAGEHAPAAEHHGGSTVYVLMAVAVVLAIGGWLIARSVYSRGIERARELAGRMSVLHRVLANKYYIDEIYDALVVQPYLGLCRVLDVFDRGVVDGTVNGGGTGVMITGQVVKLFQTGYVRNYALSFLLGAVFVLWFLLRG